MRIAAFFLALVLSIGAVYFYKSRSGFRGRPAINACINNLRLVDGAKAQWALERNLTNGSSVDYSDMLQYVKGGPPVCPNGGAYTIGVVGASPTCSFPGHKL